MICGNHGMLERYVAGQTSPEEAEEVTRHLEDCHACAQVVETLRQPSLENFSPFAAGQFDEREPPAGLDCPSLDELRAHLEGTLALDRRAEVRDHLAECDTCFERVRLLRQGLSVEGEGFVADRYTTAEFNEADETPAQEPDGSAEEVLTPAGISGFRQFLSHAAVAAAAVAVAVTATASTRRPLPFSSPRPAPPAGTFSAPGTPPGGQDIRPGGPGPGAGITPPPPANATPGMPGVGDRPSGGGGLGSSGSMFGSPTGPGGPGTGLNSATDSPLGSGGTSLSPSPPRLILPGTGTGVSPSGNPGGTPGQPRPVGTPTAPVPAPAVVMESILPIRKAGPGGAAAGPARTPEAAQKAIQEAAEAARASGAPAGIRKLQEFVQGNPEAPAEVQAFLGTLYLKTGDRERAGEAFAEAVKRLQPPIAPPVVEPAPATPPPAAPGTP